MFKKKTYKNAWVGKLLLQIFYFYLLNKNGFDFEFAAKKLFCLLNRYELQFIIV